MIIVEYNKILFESRDLRYREFNSKLIPNINKDTVIGVRSPVLRKIAKEMYKSNNYSEFLVSLPHKYFEENNLHSYIISHIKDYDECIRQINLFLPFVDNWSTCDCLNSDALKKYPDKLLEQINLWLKNEHTFTVRFAIRMLMKYFLEDNFKEEYLQIVFNIKSDEYYIKMMIAWYFATALAKQYESSLKYIESMQLDKETQNMTIQKAIDSFRISEIQKQHLRKFRIR